MGIKTAFLPLIILKKELFKVEMVIMHWIVINMDT